MLERSEIAQLIPHAGSMCLVDRVLSWDDTTAHLSSDSHHRSDHPLRRDGRLDAVHLVEYAAQSMAIHSALLGRQHGVSLTYGYLAAVHHVELEVTRLDDVAASLDLYCQRLMDNGIYSFHTRADQQMLASGRLTVVTVRPAEQGGDT